MRRFLRRLRPRFRVRTLVVVVGIVALVIGAYLNWQRHVGLRKMAEAFEIAAQDDADTASYFDSLAEYHLDFAERSRRELERYVAPLDAMLRAELLEHQENSARQDRVKAAASRKSASAYRDRERLAYRISRRYRHAAYRPWLNINPRRDPDISSYIRLLEDATYDRPPEPPPLPHDNGNTYPDHPPRLVGRPQ